MINAYYNDNELRDLFLKLKLDYEGLDGDNKAAKARELVLYCERHGRDTELIMMLQQERSHAVWPMM